MTLLGWLSHQWLCQWLLVTSNDLGSSWAESPGVYTLEAPEKLPGPKRKVVFPPLCFRWYCWWKKSANHLGCIRFVNHGILTISTGAGFLPSTVCYTLGRVRALHLRATLQIPNSNNANQNPHAIWDYTEHQQLKTTHKNSCFAEHVPLCLTWYPIGSMHAWHPYLLI